MQMHTDAQQQRIEQLARRFAPEAAAAAADYAAHSLTSDSDYDAFNNSFTAIQLLTDMQYERFSSADQRTLLAECIASSDYASNSSIANALLMLAAFNQLNTDAADFAAECIAPTTY